MSLINVLNERYRTLLGISEAIAAHHDVEELLRDLAQNLPRVIRCSSIAMALHDAGRGVMRLHVLEALQPAPVSPGVECPIEEVPGGWVWQTQEPFVCTSVERETRFPEAIPMFRAAGVQSFCMIPLTTARQRLGAMGVGNPEEHDYEPAEIDFLWQVARQVAVAVENAQNFERAHQAEKDLQRQLERERLMLEVNNAVVSHLDLRELLKVISSAVRRVVPHDGALLTLHEPESTQLRLHALDLQMFDQVPFEEGVLISLDDTPEGQAIASRQPVLVSPVVDLERFTSPWVRHAVDKGVRSGCAVPLITHNRTVGALSMVSAHDNAFTANDADLLSQCANQIAIAVENALVYREIAELKDKLAKEKLYLEEEILTDHNFEAIIGESFALRRVLKQVQTVAVTDSTVLILGETGSGKELVARALHNLSNRRERTFVKINCAAIPTGLLESELFGHERGAFTGAIATKIGRFELADRGTIFLDEVGEIPLELQVKLLRVLQEQEFERLGSTRTMRVNVRIVAATNRDLDQMVAAERFRSDLYYRLRVFPVTVPSLRDRVEDIPLLVKHFAQKFAKRMNKPIETIPSEAMKALEAYHWPGNVRELENLIERAVILSSHTDLRVPLSELKRSAPPKAHAEATTLKHAEREHILKVLRETKWSIGGPTGAAVKLGMKRTTLQSRIRKLGIVRPS